MSQQVVIIGGGIIGLSNAWFLSKSGCQVTVVDRAEIGAACSAGNCGLICPSHVLPLTEPGAFKEAAKALLASNSAFKIRPRLDPNLWSWLWNFARRCNRTAMIQSAHAIQALLVSAKQEYLQWVTESSQGGDGIECEWQERGLLFVYRDASALNAFDETNQLLSEQFNEPATKLQTEELLQVEPALKPTVAGGWMYHNDAHLRPDVLISSLQRELTTRGVQFVTGCEFQEFQGTNGNITHAVTSKGNFAADLFVMASGAWTPLLHEHVGVRVPIQPGKGYSITMPHPKVCPKLPIIFPQHHVAVTPMESGYRLGSIMEFAGYDASIHPSKLQLLRQGAEPYLHEPYCEPETSIWYGWRPMTYDSVPVIDRSPKWKNAWVTAGHNMLGLSMAPASGRLLAELATDGSPHIDPAPYRLARFK